MALIVHPAQKNAAWLRPGYSPSEKISIKSGNTLRSWRGIGSWFLPWKEDWSSPLESPSSASSSIPLKDSTSFSAANNSSRRPVIRLNCCSLHCQDIFLLTTLLPCLMLSWPSMQSDAQWALVKYSLGSLEEQCCDVHLNWSKDRKSNSVLASALAVACHKPIPEWVRFSPDIAFCWRWSPDKVINKTMLILFSQRMMNVIYTGGIIT